MSPAPLSDFSQDRLSRESLADYLTHFITTSQPTTNEHSRVIALDSGWGTGKTSFVNMWTKKLEDADASPFVCLKYNAWENDDSPDALMPIICSFQQLIDESTPKGQGLKRSLANIVSTFGPKFLGLITQVTCGVNPEGFVEAYKEYREKKLPDMIFEEFSALQEHKELFRKLTEDIRGEHPYLLICIDELDRCRPTFAIETLEVVKHFFDLPNVIFAFSLDMKQLHRSIKMVYGDIDSMGYLQRFFDYQISLPKPELRMFLMERLVDCEGGTLDLEIVLLQDLMEKYSLSLRTLDVICSEYIHFLERKKLITGKHHSQFPPEYRRAYLILFCMKSMNSLAYFDLLHYGTTPGNPLSTNWIESFVLDHSSIVDDGMSVYTREFLDMPLYKFIFEEGGDIHYQHAKNSFLLPEGEFCECRNIDISNLTLAQVIFNNVEYGCIFPTEEHLNPEK